MIGRLIDKLLFSRIDDRICELRMRRDVHLTREMMEMIAPNVQAMMDALAAQTEVIGQAVTAIGGMKTRMGDMQAQMDAMAQQIATLQAAPAAAIDAENDAAVGQMAAAVAASTDALKGAIA